MFHLSSSLRARPRTSRLFGGALVALVALLGLPPSSNAQISQEETTGGVIELTNKASTKTPTKSPVTSTRSPRVRMPRPNGSSRVHRFEGYIEEAARLYQLPPALIKAVMRVESNFDPSVISPANAHGLMQLMPRTAERMMVTDIFDPRQNILGGARYLRILANLFNGDLQLTLAAYNAGEGAVARYGGIPPYEETQRYVSLVAEHYFRYSAE